MSHLNHPRDRLARDRRRGFFFRGLLAGCLAMLGLGCSLAATERSSSATQNVLAPWVQDGEYKVQVVPLKTMQNLTDLEGSSALFMLSPSIVNQRLMGFRPRVRTFQDARGVHVPTDAFSMHLITLYAHLEKLRELDEWVGFGNVLPEPRIVGVEVRIPQKKKNHFLGNNALYSPQLDALLFVPYGEDHLTLTVNGGVIGHEYFHALFNFLVLKPTRDVLKSEEAGAIHAQEEDELREVFIDLPRFEGKIHPPLDTEGKKDWELYHVNLLRAMNEGLADVWGWIYSGDTIFVRRSLPFLKSARDLDVKVTQIQTLKTFREKTWQGALSGEETEAAYVLANQYASSLRTVFQPYLAKKNSDRRELARKIVEVMPLLTERIKSLKKDQWMKPSLLLELFAEKSAPRDRELCESLMRLMPDVQPAEVQNRCGATVESL